MASFIFQHRICNSFFLSSPKAIENLPTNELDLYEYRHDLSTNINLQQVAKLKSSLNGNLIFTCRPATNNTPTIQQTAYAAALQAGFNYLDIDASTDKPILKALEQTYPSLHQQLILSKHYYEKMPNTQTIADDLAEMTAENPKWIKIACQLNSIKDLDHLQEWQRQRQDIIFVAMGKYALTFRVWSLVHTAIPFTYAALKTHTATVAQQPDYKTVVQHVRNTLGRSFFLSALIGKQVQHSLSPILFAHYIQAQQISNAYYHKYNLPSAQDITKLMQYYHAFNITAPYKEDIILFLQHISPAAQAIGAVNTAYIKEGKWYGENTDHIGILKSIEPYLPKLQTALIIGAGGAARAAAYCLQQQKIRSHIFNRTFAKAEELAAQFEAIAIKYIQNINTYQLIINTSPVLLETIIKLLPHYKSLVLDAIYPQSVIAPHLQQTSAKLIKGELWLKAQGEAAFCCFFQE